MLKKICVFLLAIYSLAVFANNPQNGWNVYTAMKEVRSVSLTGNTIWAASTGGLFRVDAGNLSDIKKFTTLDGLLSNELNSSIADLDGNIWVGAIDGSINFYNPTDGTFKVVTDIRNSAESNKKVNHFFQYGNSMFFATEFCIVRFSISQFQFVDQPYIFLGPQLSPKTPVNWIHVVNDTVWAATDGGIAYANINTNLPIQTNWKNFTTSNSVLNRNQINTIAYFNNRVFFGTDSGMVYFEGGTLTKFEPLFNGNPLREGVNNMLASGNSLYFSSYRNSERIYKVSASNLSSAVQVYSGYPPNFFKVGNNNDLIVGTRYGGVDVYRNNTHNNIIPDGPFSNLIFNMGVDNNSNLWAVSGSLGTWQNESGVYKFNGTNWKNFTLAQNPELGGGCCGYTEVYASKNGLDVWIGGFGNGLLKIENDVLTRYNAQNSVLKELGHDFVLALGLYEDSNGKLWVCNNYTVTPFVNFADQLVYPVPIGSPSSYFFREMTIDNYNTMWCILDINEPLTPRGVFYYNIPANSYRLINYAELGANVSAVNDIITDKNGEVWIATNNGIIVFSDPSQAINEPGSLPSHHKMSIIENGLSTPLTENVTALEKDALNNKWIGTFSNGLLYVSPDGSTLLGRYNTINSPLTDNRINKIACDPKTGTAYFGTVKGLVSFKTIAIDPLADCSSISVGPNPFVIPNSSQLRIDGLVAESTVKILTISGTLVSEFETPGGRVTNWDGRDQYGNYVSSGIYVIVGYNKDGSKVCTGKVAVVRK